MRRFIVAGILIIGISTPIWESSIPRIMFEIPRSGPLEGGEPLLVIQPFMEVIPQTEGKPIMQSEVPKPAIIENKPGVVPPPTILSPFAVQPSIIEYFPYKPPIVYNPSCQQQTSGCK